VDAVTNVPPPVNEPVRSYAPGSPERASLEVRLQELGASPVDLTMTIAGQQRPGSGDAIEVVQPHRHAAVLGTTHDAGPADVQAAVDAALQAAPAWRDASYDDRAAVLLRAADLLAGPWRDTLNAATMLGQSKTAFQAEIDSACELIDFLRFNVAFGRSCSRSSRSRAPGSGTAPTTGRSRASSSPSRRSTSPRSRQPAARAGAHGQHGRLEALADPAAVGALRHAAARGGRAAAGVVNMVTGNGAAVSEVAVPHPELAGIHFTGSTRPSSACGRRSRRAAELPQLPAPGGGDRRQGLRRGAPVR
jgi:1-pyrroline-5-carboxylate dehydrogenase